MLPDKRGKTYRVPGEFIVNVINTCEAQWLDNVLMDAVRKRNEGVSKDK